MNKRQPIIAIVCPECGEPLVKRTRHADGVKFVGCKGYPVCRFATDVWAVDKAMIDLAAQLGEKAEMKAETESLRWRNGLLEGQVAFMRSRIIELEAALSAARQQQAGWSPVLPEAGDLRRLMMLFHPDRHPTGTVSAHEVTAALSALRDRVNGSRR